MTTQVSERARLLVAKWPNRKRPTLCIQNGVTSTIIAYFRDDESAEEFMRIARFGIGVYAHRTVWDCCEG